MGFLSGLGTGFSQQSESCFASLEACCDLDRLELYVVGYNAGQAQGPKSGANMGYDPSMPKVSAPEQQLPGSGSHGTQQYGYAAQQTQPANQVRQSSV